MVTDHRVDLDLAEESASCLERTEEEYGHGRSDSHINASFDVLEYGDKNAREEDNDFEWADEPELIHRIGRRDQVANGVDNDA